MHRCVAVGVVVVVSVVAVVGDVAVGVCVDDVVWCRW